MQESLTLNDLSNLLWLETLNEYKGNDEVDYSDLGLGEKVLMFDCESADIDSEDFGHSIDKLVEAGLLVEKWEDEIYQLEFTPVGNKIAEALGNLDDLDKSDGSDKSCSEGKEALTKSYTNIKKIVINHADEIIELIACFGLSIFNMIVNK